MKQCVTLTALAVALLALPLSAMAVNTITFDGEVTAQTCTVNVEGSTDPVILLSSIPQTDLDGAVGKVGGETSFNINLVGCASGATAETYTTRFSPISPTTSGNLSNTAASGAADVALQLLDGPSGGVVDFSNGAVNAGAIELAAGDTTASGTYAVQYVAEAATVGVGPVTGAVMYTVRYE
ncbi:fimbrial protein [Halomonas citrativorans]|uniref:fimbrial protein n=1 Tax=Halomonas citrativorans TaxID=2742612 RepID=UPI000B34DB8D|nr:fimbrial protein [Halomonas citrativorans]